MLSNNDNADRTDYVTIIMQQLEIIHTQQKTIDCQVETINTLTKLQNNNKDLEERIIVPESQKVIGKEPWPRFKSRLEKKYASKIGQAVQIHGSGSERSDNGEESSE